MDQSDVKKAWIPLFGNVFEHFDKALFSLLMPFIATIFFGPISIYKSLALAFLPVETIFRPLGAYLLTKRGDQIGRKKLFLQSIQYTGIISLGFAFLPSYSQIGVLSCFFLLSLRALLAFVSSVETTGAVLLVMEKSSAREKMSSYYQISGMLGVFLATCLVLLLAYFGKIQAYWRGLYIIGALACLFVATFKTSIKETYQKPKAKKQAFPIRSFFALCFAHGFSYGNYFILMTVLHIFLQNILQLSAFATMQMQVFLIALDMCLLWLLVPVIKNRSPHQLVLFCLFATACLAFPLFGFLKKATLLKIFIVRAILLTIGVIFAINLPTWSLSLFPADQRYRVFALAKAIGGQWLGSPSISICMLLYERFHSPYVFASYLCTITVLAIGFIIFAKEKKSVVGQLN